MRTLEELKVQLETLKPTLKECYEVDTLGIFGSYVRGEQTEKSDLDILVEISGSIGIYKFIELQELLRKKLRVKVDLVQKDALKPMLKDQILQETILI